MDVQRSEISRLRQQVHDLAATAGADAGGAGGATPAGAAAAAGAAPAAGAAGPEAAAPAERPYSSAAHAAAEPSPQQPRAASALH